MLGEMSDSGTVETVPRASETGHLVLTTIHAPGAPHDIERVIDMLPANQQDQVRAQRGARCPVPEAGAESSLR